MDGTPELDVKEVEVVEIVEKEDDELEEAKVEDEEDDEEIIAGVVVLEEDRAMALEDEEEDVVERLEVDEVLVAGFVKKTIATPPTIKIRITITTTAIIADLAIACFQFKYVRSMKRNRS